MNIRKITNDLRIINLILSVVALFVTVKALKETKYDYDDEYEEDEENEAS
ncbi:hypothetical protein ACSZOP_00575 [Colibacter massiliensis]